MFPLILLQAKAGGYAEGTTLRYRTEFPLILLQAKAGGINLYYGVGVRFQVSINSPSGEGGGGESL